MSRCVEMTTGAFVQYTYTSKERRFTYLELIAEVEKSVGPLVGLFDDLTAGSVVCTVVNCAEIFTCFHCALIVRCKSRVDVVVAEKRGETIGICRMSEIVNVMELNYAN